jgi:cell division transport system ATP-binding protein
LTQKAYKITNFAKKMSEKLIISLRDTYIKHQQFTVLEDVNLDIAEGEFVYLIGKTGSGKSSLLKVLYGDLPLKEGQGRLVDFELHHLKTAQIPYLRRKIGVIFQDFELLKDRSVEDNLYFVLKATDWTDQAAMNERIDEVLSAVDLENIRIKMPHQLSGGEQQRVVIARALLNHPKILLADEPTGNLDPTVANSILELFKKINKEGTAVLMATHHHSFLKRFPARVLYCENGKIKDIDKDMVIKKMES